MKYAPTLADGCLVSSAKTSQRGLQHTLGSFWSSVFADKSLIKGYTLGMAEELIQSYYDLMEVVGSYAVDKISVLHRSRWCPIVIQKSSYNSAPFEFGSSGTVFGIQPELDAFYAGEMFKFGRPKNPAGNIYSFKPAVGIMDFSVIADRVISPSKLYLNGVDVVMRNGVLYFNSDVFNDEQIPKTEVISDLGTNVTYVDAHGVTQNDELVILWAYNAGIDTNNIQDNFGALFGINLSSTEAYKAIMMAVVALYAGGPTVKQVTAAVSAFLGAEGVASAREVIQAQYKDNLGLHIITDKTAYLFDSRYNMLESLRIGSVVTAGDQLVDAFQLFDHCSVINWWETQLATPKLPLPGFLFTGTYESQLIFENSLQPVGLNAGGDVTFPVTGTARDVEEFHKELNLSARKTAVKNALGLADTNVGVVNPLDFLFRNFFKNNTTILRLRLLDQPAFELFFQLNTVLRRHLPPHVFVLYMVDLELPTEHITNLNSYMTVDGLTETLAVDGSSLLYPNRTAVANIAAVPVPGQPTQLTVAAVTHLAVGQRLKLNVGYALYTIMDITGLVVTLDKEYPSSVTSFYFDTLSYSGRPTKDEDPDYFKDYEHRLFCVAQSPIRGLPPAPLYHENNLDTITSSATMGSRVNDGACLTEIPAGATTREISSLLLIDFS